MDYYYALVNAGRVSGVLKTFAEIDAPNLRRVDSEDACRPGDIDHGDGTFSPPEPPPPDRRMSRLAFARRFTVLEEAALDLASIDDPAASTETRMQKATLRAMRSRQSQADYIDLDDADTQAGVQALASLGLLTAERASDILGAPVRPEERP